ncbi:serine hydrolase domain-containing protein [Nocardia sp. NPDC059180]|uniref:serine hydrolase domain-containing protein n=1 Tax=Nocardia sp. NPDC059180 TaxID=3346761 RepID=UPI0036B2E2A0
MRLTIFASVAALSLGGCSSATAPDVAEGVPPGSTDTSTGLDPVRLRSALDAVHDAGMPGVFAEVRDGDQIWRGASGVADLETGRPIQDDMLQRVGSITKTFTATAIMQQVDQDRIRLDAPIGDYLPHLVPGDRGKKITVRMLLNHTSGLADYLPTAFPSLASFPSLADVSPESLDDNRFTEFRPTELIEMGVNAPATGEPGSSPGVYSNTNYFLLGELLEQVTGTTMENYIAENVIERAGLRDTAFPDEPRIDGPHSRMYESMYGMIDPPRDYSEYSISWMKPGAGLVSTTADLNRFYAELLGGELVSPSSLAQMQDTVAVIAQDGQTIDYGLGLQRIELPGCGTFWGHGGTVFGALTWSWTRADGKRQMTVAMNLMRWNKLDATGTPQPHPIDDGLSAFYQEARCGN